MVRTLAAFLLAALLASLVACSPGPEESPQRKDEDVGQKTRSSERTAPGNAGAPGVPGGETTAGAPASWDYVALGDSLAAGVGARRGYVDRYATNVRGDTGARVEVVNLGVSGQTSSELLDALRNDASMRRALGGAEVVTFNIGINDLGRAGRAYENGTCGGGDGEDCLRAAVEEVKANWDAVLSELSGLSSTEDTIIRTAGLGYTPRVDEVFEPYLREVNRHIAATAADNGIPHAEVRLGEEGMSPDGVHPNDKGYEVIAERLRELGYDPLSSP